MLFHRYAELDMFQTPAGASRAERAPGPEKAAPYSQVQGEGDGESGQAVQWGVEEPG